MSSENRKSIQFTPEEFQVIEDLAGINYTIKQIAMYFDVSATLLYNEYQNKESDFAYHFDRGVLLASADVDMKLLNAAKDGNLTASAQFKKASNESKINRLKHELFGI